MMAAAKWYDNDAYTCCREDRCIDSPKTENKVYFSVIVFQE